MATSFKHLLMTFAVLPLLSFALAMPASSDPETDIMTRATTLVKLFGSASTTIVTSGNSTDVDTSAEDITTRSTDATGCKVFIARFYQSSTCEGLPNFSRCTSTSIGCVNVNADDGPLPHGFNCVDVGVNTCKLYLYPYGCSQGAGAYIGKVTQENFQMGQTMYGYSVTC